MPSRALQFWQGPIQTMRAAAARARMGAKGRAGLAGVRHCGATLIFVPTKRPRLTVTETPEVERRLNFAASRFPALAGRRRELLLRLTELGEQALVERAEGDDPRTQAKRRILARTRAITEADARAMMAAREDEWRHELNA